MKGTKLVQYPLGTRTYYLLLFLAFCNQGAGITAPFPRVGTQVVAHVQGTPTILVAANLFGDSFGAQDEDGNQVYDLTSQHLPTDQHAKHDTGISTIVGAIQLFYFHGSVLNAKVISVSESHQRLRITCAGS